MITRKERATRSATERFVDTFVTTYFSNLSSDQFTYLDGVYRTIANRIAQLRDVRDIKLNYLDDYSIVKKDIYETLFNKSLLLADLNYRMIPEVFSDLNRIYNNVIEGAENLSKQITVAEDIVKTLEGSLKQKVSISSIKNEVLIYDTIGSSTYVSEGTLAKDKRAGLVTLGINKTEYIPFKIKNVIVNKDKGTMSRPLIGDLTWDNINNGYFTSRSFSDSPLFENSSTSDINRMSDQNMETSYLVEYNSDDDREELKMGIELEFDTGRIDMINVVVDPSDMVSVMTSSVILPKMTRILTHGKEDVEDVTSKSMDNTIEANGYVLGETETDISHKRPDIYPTGSFFISTNDISSLTMELTSDEPQEIFYPEKIIKDGSGNILHKFNYFETLVLNKYQPPLEYVGPTEFYTPQEITELGEIEATGSDIHDERNHIFRYFIGIKEIQLLRLTYASEGSIITADLNTSGKKIAGADLFVNEYVPEGTEIHYYYSADTVDWFEIAPGSRVDIGDLPRRIVFQGFDVLRGDLLIPTVTTSLFLKIEMKGTGDITPVLKSYAARIKLM